MKFPAFGLLALAALCALPSTTRADSFPAWQKQITDKGCFLYQYEESVGGMESDLQPTGYVWSGPCTPGQPINGEGTLYEQHNYRFSDGELSQWIRSHSGRLVNGLFEGKVNHRRHDVDALGYWNPATGYVEDPEYASSFYYQGCTKEMMDDGWTANYCQPGKVIDPIIVPRVASAYFPLPDALVDGGANAPPPVAPPAPQTPFPDIGATPPPPSPPQPALARIDPATNSAWNNVPRRKTPASGTRLLADSANPAQRTLRQQQVAADSARREQQRQQRSRSSGVGSALFGALLQTAAVATVVKADPNAALTLASTLNSAADAQATQRLTMGAVTALAGGNSQQINQALNGQVITAATPSMPSVTTPIAGQSQPRVIDQGHVEVFDAPAYGSGYTSTGNKNSAPESMGQRIYDTPAQYAASQGRYESPVAATQLVQDFPQPDATRCLIPVEPDKAFPNAFYVGFKNGCREELKVHICIFSTSLNRWDCGTSTTAPGEVMKRYSHHTNGRYAYAACTLPALRGRYRNGNCGGNPNTQNANLVGLH